MCYLYVVPHQALSADAKKYDESMLIDIDMVLQPSASVHVSGVLDVLHRKVVDLIMTSGSERRRYPGAFEAGFAR